MGLLQKKEESYRASSWKKTHKPPQTSPKAPARRKDEGEPKALAFKLMLRRYTPKRCHMQTPCFTPVTAWQNFPTDLFSGNTPWEGKPSPALIFFQSSTWESHAAWPRTHWDLASLQERMDILHQPCSNHHFESGEKQLGGSRSTYQPVRCMFL